MTFHTLNDLQTKIKTFTHDYYMIDLPKKPPADFYKYFAFYKENYNFRQELITIAPVIRIYGTNQFGQKCCCHIHGYFPSFFIKADQFEQCFKNEISLCEFLLKVEELYKNVFKIDKPIIYKAELQYKFDFYGYHTKKEAFLKIMLYDQMYVPKMRELLGSKIINNKFFQCYEAHINYFMQFFSDFNIYGIHQMKICGFSFRKNLQIMPLFQKINSGLLLGINKSGWDLIELETKQPQLFNSLYKISCCYIEIDLTIDSIMNAYSNQKNIVDSEEEQICSSDQEITQKHQGVKKLEIHVTKALEEIWRDQKKRRSRFKIKKPLEGIIDFSKNVEKSKEVEEGKKDPLWINFLKKGENFSDFVKMIKSYNQSSLIPQAKDIFYSRGISEDYNQILIKERNQLIEKVKNRWKYYENRKNGIIKQIIQGERSELPEWEDDEEAIHSEPQKEDHSSESSNSQDLGEDFIEDTFIKEKNSQKSQRSQRDKSQKYQKSFIESIDERKNNKGNTVKYRNNFKFQLGKTKSKGFFSSCENCRENIYDCSCIWCDKCLNYQQNCCCQKQEVEQANSFVFESLNDIDQQLPQKQHNNQQQIQIYQFYLAPPEITENMLKQPQVSYQKPFYSNKQDLLAHYKIGTYFQPENKIAQYLDKQLMNTTFFDREPSTIKNEHKLPYFYEIYQAREDDNIITKSYCLEYMQCPPIISEVKLEPQQNMIKPRQPSLNKFQDTFVSDIIIFTFQLLIEMPETTFYYGNPEIHSIFGIIYELYNYKSPLTPIRGLVILQKYSLDIKTQQFDEIWIVRSESNIFSLIISLIFRVDVDLFVSYDHEKKGVRYLIQRALLNQINLMKCLSRCADLQQIFEHINFNDFKIKKQTYLRRQYLLHGNVMEMSKNFRNKHNNQYYIKILQQKIKERMKKKPVLREKYTFSLEMKGRVNINLSRICQFQLKLKSYTIESVVNHLYNQHICEFTDAELYSKFIKNGNNQVLSYVLKRVELERSIIHQLNIIGGIIEKSKIYGADFVSMVSNMDLQMQRWKEGVSSKQNLSCVGLPNKTNTLLYQLIKVKSLINLYQSVDPQFLNLPNNISQSKLYLIFQTCLTL